MDLHGTSRWWGLAVSTVDQGDQLYGEGRGEDIMLQKTDFMLKICTSLLCSESGKLCTLIMPLGHLRTAYYGGIMDDILNRLLCSKLYRHNIHIPSKEKPTSFLY